MGQSMTAFATQYAQGEWGQMSWEIRSVNHRYCELSVRMPEIFSGIESKVRELVKAKLIRGKIESRLTYRVMDAEPRELQLNDELVSQLSLASQTVAAKLGEQATQDVMQLLQWPGVIKPMTHDEDLLTSVALTLLEETLTEVVDVRCREGEALKTFILQRVEQMLVEVSCARKISPLVLQAQQDKLVARFAKMAIEVDEQRLSQEMVLYAQKMDITEELDRLDTHLAEIRKILQTAEVMGRRLDFLMQELNREANTLSSKSTDSQLTSHTVEMKVLVEQMREQIQNLV